MPKKKTKKKKPKPKLQLIPNAVIGKTVRTRKKPASLGLIPFIDFKTKHDELLHAIPAKKKKKKKFKIKLKGRGGRTIV